MWLLAADSTTQLKSRKHAALMMLRLETAFVCRLLRVAPLGASPSASFSGPQTHAMNASVMAIRAGYGSVLAG
jgi:hypothetical protein